MRSDYVNALVRVPTFAREASRWSKGVWSSRLRLYPQEMFQILFPVPPLEEQRQISQRIREQDKKMAELIQESELGITLLQERRTALISAAVTGKIDVRRSVAKPVMSATQYSSGFAHQLLAAEILDRCNSQRMGRIKLQKLIHLCEYHGQVSEVQGDYSRKAAGPFDAKAMAGISKNLKKQKWFEEVKEGERYVYRPLEKRGEHKKYLAHWQAEMPRIDEVLSLLGNFRTRECEIVSTLYAAWNDLLIDGGSTNDAAILHEASSAERWHKSKEQIAPERWKKALQWMKDKGLVPVGYGKHTRHTVGQIGTTPEEAHEPA
jgi:type I restriction enzyme S subunit